MNPDWLDIPRLEFEIRGIDGSTVHFAPQTVLASRCRLVELLDQAPSTPAGEYFRDQDADLGSFVSQSVDPQVWRAFHGLLERADLAMRMA